MTRSTIRERIENRFSIVAARERVGFGANEKTGTFISARMSPKWVKRIDQPNKWMRSHDRKINFQEPSIRAKPSTVKLDKRPKTSKKISSQLQSTPPAQSPPTLDYHKIIDALQYGAVAEKCILLEALRWVRVKKSVFPGKIDCVFHL